MTNMKATRGDNLGFAIPINYVKDFLRNRERVRLRQGQPEHGVSLPRPAPPPAARTRRQEPPGQRGCEGRVPRRRERPSLASRIASEPERSSAARDNAAIGSERRGLGLRHAGLVRHRRSVQHKHGAIGAMGPGREALVVSDRTLSRGVFDRCVSRRGRVLRLALAAGSAWPVSICSPLPGPGRRPRKTLPDSTSSSLKVNNAAALREAFEQSQFGQLWTDPAMKPLKDDLLSKLATTRNKAQGDTVGVSIGELLELPQGPLLRWRSSAETTPRCRRDPDRPTPARTPGA